MAFTSQQHNFSNEYCELPIPMAGLAMWYEESSIVPRFFDNYSYGVPNIMSSEYDIMTTSSGSSITSFPDRLGVSDMGLVPEISTGLCSIAGTQAEDEYSSTGFVSNIYPLYPSPIHNWEMSKRAQGIEEPTMKIGKYSMEERKEKIMRYLKKRNQRNFNKTIKYECRKTLADKRVRVRGRFAKNNEACERQLLPNQTNSNSNPCDEDAGLFYSDDFQMKQDYEEEEWLQDAMASLLYSPYITMPNC